MSYQLNTPYYSNDPVNGAGVKLSWTWPPPGFIGTLDPLSATLYIQRSSSTDPAVYNHWPLSPNFVKNQGAQSEPDPETGWATIGIISVPPQYMFDTAPAQFRTYIDLMSPPTSNLSYRIVGFIQTDVSTFVECDWAPAVLSVTGTSVPGMETMQRLFGGKAGVQAGGIVPTGIAMDANGNIIVVGVMSYTANPGNGEMTVFQGSGTDCIIAKYAPNGTCLWAHHYGGSSNDQFNGVVADSSGNIYAIGSISGGPFASTVDLGFGTVDNTYGSSDVLLAKFDTNGNVLWHKVFGGSGSDTGETIALSGDFIYIGGTHGFFGTGINFGAGALPLMGRPSGFLAKLNVADGTLVWANSFGNNSNPTYVIKIAVGTDGHPIIASDFQTTGYYGGAVLTGLGGYDCVFAKFDKDTGAFTWNNHVRGSSDQRATGVAVGPDNSIYAVGNYVGTTTFAPGHTMTGLLGSNVFVVRYTATGDWVSEASYGSDINGPRSFGVVADSVGAFTIGGFVADQIDWGEGFISGDGNNAGFLCRYNQGGSAAWTRRSGTPPFTTGATDIRAVALGPSNQIAVTGTCGDAGVGGFWRVTGFGQQALVAPLTEVKEPAFQVHPTGFWAIFSP